MTKQVLLKVYNYILDHSMLQENRHVILGVSGGADSMCLLFILESLKEKLGLTLTVVHINHGLRGEAAAEDQKFVQEYCADHHIECIVFQTNIREMALAQKLTEEEAGRIYRYDCFHKVMLEKGAGHIAVAHHQDDQAETVLFNLVRGSGITGLAGILPVREHIIRPLLCLTRSEIEGVLWEAGLSYQTDQTNFDTLYTRNKMRHHVLPYLTSEINPEASQHIAQAADYIREVREYIYEQTAVALGNIEDDLGRLKIDVLKKQPVVIQKETLRLWIKQKTGKLKDITSEHIQFILELSERQSGKYICLPDNLIVYRTGDYLQILTQKELKNFQNHDFKGLYIKIEDMDREYVIPDQNLYSVPNMEPKNNVLEFEIINYDGDRIIPENDYTKWFDYDKIKDTLIIRNRQSEDYMTLAHGLSKKIRRMMIDDKIPAINRETMWLLAEGHHVLWIPGGRISEYYKVTKDTKRIMIVCLKEKEHGR